MRIAVLGIDLGKNSCSLVGLDGQGKVVKRRRMRPANIAGFTKGFPPCVIAMEVCCVPIILAAPQKAVGRRAPFITAVVATAAFRRRVHFEKSARHWIGFQVPRNMILYARVLMSDGARLPAHRASATIGGYAPPWPIAGP